MTGAAVPSEVRAMNSLRRLVSALRSSGALPHGDSRLSVAQQFALRLIGSRPGLTMTDLAEATLTTRSTVSEVVVRLVAAGLVGRETDPADGRRVRLQLTSSGTSVFEALSETLPERLVRALDAMDPASRESLATLLEGWIQLAGLSATSPVMFGEPVPAGRTATTDRPGARALPNDKRALVKGRR